MTSSLAGQASGPVAVAAETAQQARWRERLAAVKTARIYHEQVVDAYPDNDWMQQTWARLADALDLLEQEWLLRGQPSPAGGR